MLHLQPTQSKQEKAIFCEIFARKVLTWGVTCGILDLSVREGRIPRSRPADEFKRLPKVKIAHKFKAEGLGNPGISASKSTPCGQARVVNLDNCICDECRCR